MRNDWIPTIRRSPTPGNGMAHTLTLWTNDPERAAWADRAGIDRIGLDLESHGKEARQAGLGTWLSPHTLEDLELIRPSIKRAALFVRTNPFGETSEEEVAALVDRGVGVLMLPNFTTLDEVVEFLKVVDGRARVVPLVERLDAVDLVGMLAGAGVEEIHVGLNDLSIDLGLSNRLAVLAAPVMDRIVETAGAVGLEVGVGGIARAGDEALPVPSDLVYAQQARLGSSGALIARSFFTDVMSEAEFAEEISRLRARLAEWGEASPQALEAARMALQQHIAALETGPGCCAS